MKTANVKAFFDEATNTVSYVVSDPKTNRAAIIDPVLDFDPHSGRISTTQAEKLIDHVKQSGLSVDWILETHVHADHLTGAPKVERELGGTIAIGDRVSRVQSVFSGIFNIADFPADGSQFGHLFSDGDSFKVGTIDARVIATPGHTPACITYVIGDSAFVGDTLFMPDYGTARTDFPGGSAKTLYASIQKILSLPDDTRLFMCHDYKAPGRDKYAWESTVREQRESNIHINQEVTENEFIDMRQSRDGNLGMPRLLLPSIQVNIRAGQLPEAENNGIQYLKIPIDTV